MDLIRLADKKVSKKDKIKLANKIGELVTYIISETADMDLPRAAFVVGIMPKVFEKTVNNKSIRKQLRRVPK